MSAFLDHVRRQSRLQNESSEDDRTVDTDERDERYNRSPQVLMASISSRSRNALPKSLSVPNSTIVSSSLPENQLTEEDIEICQKLDEEYERALEEREIGYNARYASVRQSAVLSVCFMAAFLTLGTAFFMRQAAWTLPESMLFSIYTITTVGYGRSEMPTTPGFQAYAIFYILVGIAALTIMVAQVYQCIALEASRAQHARDKTEMKRRGLDVLQAATRARTRSSDPTSPTNCNDDEIIDFSHSSMPGLLETLFRTYDRAKFFFQNNEIGKGVSVIFPFAGLILIGAIIVGPIEEWTFLEAIYFSVVSLSTVGFGDYVPKQSVSIWFSIFWLPFSVGFMSMYLGNVAAFYIRLSDRNIRRIERHMRRRLQRAKDKAELERAEVLKRAYRGQEVEVQAALGETTESGQSDAPVIAEMTSHAIPLNHAQSLVKRNGQDGFDVLSTREGNGPGEVTRSEEQKGLFGTSAVESGHQRRQRILENSIVANYQKNGEGSTMQSMNDVIHRVRINLDAQINGKNGGIRIGPDAHFMSIRSTQTMKTHGVLREGQTRKPSFALRVLVQERFADIIAVDIAGYQSTFEIKDTTLSVTIHAMMEAADKWLVPRRARKPFRAVAFEVLYFVGEHGLVTRGSEALFDLSPFEFHALFSPLVAAMGDADTMEGWLSSTDVLAAADLPRSSMENDNEEGPATTDLEPKLENPPNSRLSTGMA